MPIWPQSTVELEQRQWHWLNVFLATTDANGKPTATTGMTGASVAYGYRYEGPNDFTARTLSYSGSASPVRATLAAGYPYTASSLTMKVSATAGTLPPTSGRVSLDKGQVATISNSATTGTLHPGTYTGVAATGGSGTGCTVKFIIDAVPSITGASVEATGSGYLIGETLTVAGNLVGGATPADDITFTVATVSVLDTVNYKSYNESTGVITFDSGSAPANSYAVAGTNITRVDWFEAGTGYYSVLVLPTELDQLGTFTVRIGNAGGSTFDVFGQNVEVIPFTGINTSSLPYAPLTCTLFGHVVDLQGNAVQNTSVYTRMLATPIMANGEGFLDKVVTTKTDSNGFFQLTVTQKTTVQVVIPDIGYSRTITVPQSTQSNLFELA